LVHNKIISNLGNIQYYLENEEKCEELLKEFFVESDRNKKDIVQVLKYIQALSHIDNNYFSDFNIFKISET